MGYYIFSYGINPNKLKESFNSKNEELFNHVKQTSTFNNYSSQGKLKKDEPSLEEALHHIIWGEPYNQKCEYVYGYALISLCNYLGKTVPHTQEIKFGYETDLINNYLASDFNIKLKIEETLFSEQLETGLPTIKDWPMDGIIHKTELETLRQLLAGIKISNEQIEELWDGEDDEEEDKACAFEHIIGIKSNIQFCIDNNLSLISFCH